MKSLFTLFAIMSAFMIALESQIFGQCLDVDLIHPTTQNSDGSISIEVNCGMAPYNFEWEGPSGESYVGSELNNLSSGTYCVTITDHLCGSLTKCIVMDPFCQGLEVLDINWHAFSHPSACGASDGFFSIRLVTFNKNASIQQRELIEVATGINHGNGPWENLSSGLYRLKFTTIEGCVVFYEFVFNALDEHIFNVDINHYCAGMPGAILINPILDDNNSIIPHTFTWSTGEVCDLTTEIYCEISGLLPGEYCVTITNEVNSQCSDIRCFTIEEIIADQPINAELHITQPCPGLNNGELSYNASGGVGGPYSISLEPSIPIKSLPEGSYEVTISDVCGNTFTTQILLTEMKAEVVATEGCVFDIPAGGDLVPINNPGTLNTTNIWGGTPDYNSTSLSNITESGVHCLTITDDRDCTLEVCEQVNVSSVELVKVENACAGGSSGSVVLNISNPTGGAITLLVDDSPIEINQFITLQEIIISGLTVGTHSIQISFEDDLSCNQMFWIEIKESQPTLVYSGYIDGLCQFDEVCNGELIGENSVTREPMAFPTSNGKCKIDYFCNGQIVETIDGDRKTLNFWEYELLLFSAVSQGIISNEVMNRYLMDLSHTHPCDDVRYCTANFQPKGNFSFNIFLNRRTPAESLGNGCFKKRCGLTTSTFCPSNQLANHGFQDDVSGPVRDCNDWVKVPMKQLSVWKSQMLATVPGIEGTVLWLEIEKWDQIQQESNEYRPANAICRQVIFCRNDLNLVIISDPSIQDCSNHTYECEGDLIHTLNEYCSFNGLNNALDNGILTCPSSGICTSNIAESIVDDNGNVFNYSCTYTGSCVSRSIISPNLPSNFFSGNFDWTISERIISNNDDALFFEKFDFYYNQGSRRPVASYKSDLTKGRFYQEYSIVDPFQTVKGSGNIVSRIIDFESNHEFGIVLDHSILKFFFESEYDVWHLESIGVNSVDISENIQLDSNFFISGKFNGVMNFGQIAVISSVDGAYFFMEISQSGELKSLLQSSNPIDLSEVSKYREHSFLLLYSNSQIYPAVHNKQHEFPQGKMLEYDPESSKFTAREVESIFDKESSFNQIDFSYNSVENNLHMLHEGVVCNNCQFPDSVNINNLTSVTYSVLNGDGIINNKQLFFSDLEYTHMIFFDDVYGEPMLYVSSRYDWFFGRENIPSGGYILKWDMIANTYELWPVHQAGPADIQIKNITMEDDLIYLGGNITVDEYSEVTVGSQSYIVNPTGYPQGFMTVLHLQDQEQFARDKELKMESSTKNISFSQATVQPNPFSDFLEVNVNLINPGQMTVEIYDIYGILHVKRNMYHHAGQSQLQINQLDHLPVGTYIIRFESMENQLNLHSKIIKY